MQKGIEIEKSDQYQRSLDGIEIDMNKTSIDAAINSLSQNVALVCQQCQGW